MTPLKQGKQHLEENGKCVEELSVSAGDTVKFHHEDDCNSLLKTHQQETEKMFEKTLKIN